jgi:prepilin-type N-terminal cleavage/methylation domain-containing protein
MRRRQSGFTIAEVLVVTTILAVLLGFSANALSRAGQGAALGGSVRVTHAALTRAKQLARADRALSSVVCMPGDPATGAPGSLQVRLSRRAATLNFDAADNGRTPMGDAREALLAGAVLVDGGTVRKAAKLAGGGRILGPALSSAPTFDPSAGFIFEADLMPSGPGQIVRLGSGADAYAFALLLEQDLSLTAEIMVRLADRPGDEPVVRRAKTAAGVVESDAWNRVGVAYDGVALVVTAHGVVEAETLVAGEASSAPDYTFMIGGGVAGLVDGVRYVTVGIGEPFSLERGVAFDIKTPLTIRFDEEGRLDRRLHGEPVRLRLVQEERIEEVAVDLAGVIR